MKLLKWICHDLKKTIKLDCLLLYFNLIFINYKSIFFEIFLFFIFQI